ncbi:transcription termination/antitermination protein NusG [Tardiphaga sp. 866_E4_N2_1]|uniref:transcription termination/antitermination protein NusG n=1 Tax=unclassified Tardiphaga TaxID=2631404 RepID=UPI003F28688C
MNQAWHILLCEPNRELTAVSALTDRGFEAMCPASYIRRPTNKRDQSGRPVLSMEATPKALIPGYAFVRILGSNEDCHAVKKVNRGIRDFYTRPTGNLDRPYYATLTDSEIADLRAVDEAAFEAFQAAVAAEKRKLEQAALPKSKQTPSVPFEKNRNVRVFSTALGKEVYGAMQQKRGDGTVKILVDHIAMLVPHVDIMEVTF